MSEPTSRCKYFLTDRIYTTVYGFKADFQLLKVQCGRTSLRVLLLRPLRVHTLQKKKKKNNFAASLSKSTDIKCIRLKFSQLIVQTAVSHQLVPRVQHSVNPTHDAFQSN